MTTATFRIIDNNNRAGEVVFNGFAIDHDFVPAGSKKQTKWALDIINAAIRDAVTDSIARWHKTTHPASSSAMPTFLTIEDAEKITTDANRTLEQWFAVMAGKPAKFFIDLKMSGRGDAGALYKAAL